MEALYYMAVLTVAILISFTLSLIYHIWYSMGKYWEKSLSMLDQ
jgi:hypothetical protein